MSEELSDTVKDAMKDSVKNLLRAAAEAPAGSESLDGDQGMIALLEESAHGPARFIRIVEGEKTVRWSFHLLPGEAKPQFYPPDLPFLAGNLTVHAWGDESGLGAFWTSVPGESLSDFHSEIRPMFDELESTPGIAEVAKLLERTGKKRPPEVWEEAVSLIPPSFLEAYSAAAQRHFGSGVPAELVALADEISDFHDSAGWASGAGKEPSGPSFMRAFRKGTRERTLTTRSFLGVSSITLKEGNVPTETT